MNDNLPKYSSAWDIISRARPLIGSLIEMLRNDMIPDLVSLTELQKVLTSYMSELERNEAIAGKFGNISFQDYSVQGMSDNEMIEEISKKTDAFRVLYNVALKKLVSADADDLPPDILEWMVHTHYLAPVDSFLQGSSELYGITSKGYDCLTKKKIRSKLCKDHPSNTIPKALRIAPDEWDLFTLFQASVIKQYYVRSGIKDYMIIPARSHKSVLLGCAISPDPDIQYTFAWIDEPTVLSVWKSYVQETISTQSVSCITVVCRSEDERSAVQDAVKDLANVDKIKLSCLEVSE